jgi:hypothetical protein
VKMTRWSAPLPCGRLQTRTTTRVLESGRIEKSTLPSWKKKGHTRLNRHGQIVYINAYLLDRFKDMYCI